MPPRPRIRLFCSVSGKALQREKHVQRIGREQNCTCHGKQIMARCIECGLVKYHDCSSHQKKTGHYIVQMDDPISMNGKSTDTYDASIHCFIIDIANQKSIFAKPCPYITFEEEIAEDNEIKEGDIILLVRNDKIIHVTRLMEREDDNAAISSFSGDENSVCYYIQSPTLLPESKSIEDVVYKWNSMKGSVRQSSLITAPKSLLTEMLRVLD